MNSNVSKTIQEFISFYNSMGRAVSVMEIMTRAPIHPTISLADIVDEIETLIEKKIILSKCGFYTLPQHADLLSLRLQQDFLLDTKWRLLLKKVSWFRHLPFIDFVVVSGSMSFGAIRETSDFDVVVGVSESRIFTARYFMSFLFFILHMRRLDDLSESSPNKFCFNHIITNKVYEKEPHNYYRYELYRHMVPVYVANNSYEQFVSTNSWADISQFNKEQYRDLMKEQSIFGKFFSKVLGGSFGACVENYLAKPIAMKRLTHYIAKKTKEGRVIVNDAELEFHFTLNYEKEFSRFSL